MADQPTNIVGNVVVKLSQGLLVCEHLHIVQCGHGRGGTTEHLLVPQDKMLADVLMMHGYCGRSKIEVKVKVTAGKRWSHHDHVVVAVGPTVNQ